MKSETGPALEGRGETGERGSHSRLVSGRFAAVVVVVFVSGSFLGFVLLLKYKILFRN